MALLRDITCTQCGQTKREVVDSLLTEAKVCSECRRANEKAKEDEYFAKLDQMPLTDRVRAIEKWIYHHERKVDHSTSMWHQSIGASA